MKNWLNEKYIHRIFIISLILKGIGSLLEVVGGVLIFFVTQQFVINFVAAITQEELTEDPKDFIANYLIQSAQHFSINSQHFLALYLLSHGIIKGLLVTGLLKEKLWSYPLAIAVFSIFSMYQLFEFTQTQSVWLLVLTAFDAIVIVLTWHEYLYMKRTGFNRKQQN